MLQKVGALPPDNAKRISRRMPKVVDALPIGELTTEDGAIFEHHDRIERLVERNPESWIRSFEGKRSAMQNIALRYRNDKGCITEVRSNDTGHTYLYIRKKKGRMADLRGERKRLPAPPSTFQFPEVDFSDRGFNWTQDELDECVRWMREQLFPDE